jgi:hypothetical protein
MAAEPTVEDLPEDVPEDVPELETIELPLDIIEIEDPDAREAAMNAFHETPEGRIHLADTARPEDIPAFIWNRWRTQAHKMNRQGRLITDFKYKGLDGESAKRKHQFATLRKQLMPKPQINTENHEAVMEEVFGGVPKSADLEPLLAGVIDVAKDATLTITQMGDLTRGAGNLLTLAENKGMDQATFTQRAKELISRIKPTPQNSAKLSVALAAAYQGAKVLAGATGKQVAVAQTVVETVARHAQAVAVERLGEESRTARIFGSLPWLAAIVGGVITTVAAARAMHDWLSGSNEANLTLEDFQNSLKAITDHTEAVQQANARASVHIPGELGFSPAPPPFQEDPRVGSIVDQLLDLKRHIADAQGRTKDRTTAGIDPSLEAVIKRINDAQAKLLDSDAIRKDIEKMIKKGASSDKIAGRVLNHVNSAKVPAHLGVALSDAALLLLTQKIVKTAVAPYTRRQKKMAAVQPLLSTRYLIISPK